MADDRLSVTVGQTSHCAADLLSRFRFEILENVMTVLTGILNPGRGF